MSEPKPRRSPCGAAECVRECGYLTREGRLCDPAARYRGKRTEAEARALMAQPRTTKPPKPRSDPEAQVGFQVDERMERAGFKVCDLSKHRKSGGVWVSAVTSGVLDRYYVRHDGLSLFVELKAPGGKLRPAQQQFIALHQHSPIEALVWYSLEDCERWLATIPTEGER